MATEKFYKIVVQKFGGTSVQDAASMTRVMEIVEQTAINDRARPLVVLSAAAGVTNALIRVGELSLKEETTEALAEIEALQARHLSIVSDLRIVKEKHEVEKALKHIFDDLRRLVKGVNLLREITPKSKDQFQSAGERCSTLIFAAAFRERLAKRRIAVDLLDSREFFLTTDEHNLARPILSEIGKRIRKHEHRIAKGAVAVAQGFIGATAEGVTTTIGRGGSDFSAAIMGVAAKAEEIQIWTDVAGILTCDPRLVKGAYPLKEVTFEDASALAFFGAKVLHPETVWPAVEAGIPVRVLSSKEPEKPGTLILGEVAKRPPLTGLALKRNVTSVRVVSKSTLPDPRIQLMVWEGLTQAKVVPLAVSFSADSAIYVLDDLKALQDIRSEIEQFAQVDIDTSRALLTIVGPALREQAGIASRLFGALGDINCEMISYGGSASTVSLIVSDEQAEPATRKLHDAFFAKR
ncbi:MAG TPA: aspartate kinase [Candidatus Kapabacteria bacterium]|nr:aspartate kinase [Candidatus Kapabacteria bacterium]